MGDRALLNRINKLQELEARQQEINGQIETLKDEIKKDMEKKGVEQQNVDNFVVRWSKIITKRFDSKAFQKEYSFLYEEFCRQQESRRFSVVLQK